MKTEKPACGSCPDKGERCEETCTQADAAEFRFASRNDVKSVIAVMSGKGGVGKSTVTALLASTMAKRGYGVGVLDGDITGPSIPRLFGLKGGNLRTGPHGIIPRETDLGIKVMSLNLFTEREDEAVIWRGPLLAGAVKQFWEEVDWGELDYLFVDLPPGTGDVPLTVLQSLPLKGVVIVLSPQDLAVMIVRKAVNMTRQLHVPIVGLVENMAYLECPRCGEVLYPFGKPQGEQVSRETGIPLLATLPIKPDITRFGDEGMVEMLEAGEVSRMVERLQELNLHQELAENGQPENS
ncbi:MAG TPA: Mrp/NBP35 family ATP-binding protein [Syntrophomonadaceae bacterium]|nr:Mrp/NBP35 family ATP-binding protein [Syntrophomonadaceae bacterium]